MSEYTELVARLKKFSDFLGGGNSVGLAAAAIEALDVDNARLTKCLKTANGNHEEFERKWCLVTDERDRLAAELAQIRAQEPVGYCHSGQLSAIWSGYAYLYQKQESGASKPLYAHPVAQPVRELSDADLERIALEEEFLLFCDMDEFKDIARAIIAASKGEKA